MAARVARHARREKPAHWHVDQLTRVAKAICGRGSRARRFPLLGKMLGSARTRASSSEADADSRGENTLKQ
ncbi:MAG: hypothetical protein WBQ53_08445 [Methylocystis sp.]